MVFLSNVDMRIRKVSWPGWKGARPRALWTLSKKLLGELRSHSPTTSNGTYLVELLWLRIPTNGLLSLLTAGDFANQSSSRSC